MSWGTRSGTLQMVRSDFTLRETLIRHAHAAAWTCSAMPSSNRM